MAGLGSIDVEVRVVDRAEDRRKHFASEVRRFLETLLLILVVLKLAGLVTWSWWFVTLPFTAPVAIALPFVAFTLYRHWSSPRYPCG